MDFREFLFALSVTSRGTFDQKLGWMFSLYDANNDGHVTRGEMVEIMKVNIKHCLIVSDDDNLACRQIAESHKMKCVLTIHINYSILPITFLEILSVKMF